MQEAADLLNVSHTALMQMLDSGVLDFCMVGIERRIRVENLDRTCKPCDDFWRFASGTWLDKTLCVPLQSYGWHLYDSRSGMT